LYFPTTALPASGSMGVVSAFLIRVKAPQYIFMQKELFKIINKELNLQGNKNITLSSLKIRIEKLNLLSNISEQLS
jgi:hypothetical protein